MSTSRTRSLVAFSTTMILAGASAGLAASPGGTGDRVVLQGAETLGGPVAGVPVDVDLRQLPPPEGRLSEHGRPRRFYDGGKPVDTPARLDPLVQEQWAFRGGEPDFTEVHNFEGNHSTANPNDPTGDVGLELFVEAINGPGGTSVTMYSKEDTTLQAGPFALDSLAPGGSACASGLGDPIVLYDHLADRWFLSEFSSGGNRLCVYTARTEDPITGGWCFYEFADTSFPDYPKYGVWPDVYTASANQGNSPPIYAFDRVNMLSPDGTTCPVARPTQKRTGPGLPGLGFEAFTPVDLDGPAPPSGESAYFTRHRDGELHGDPPDPDFDRIELWSLDVDFDTPANTTFTQLPNIVVADFDSNLCPPLNVFSCVPQPNGGPPLDPLLEVVMNRASYRNFGTHASILATLQTDVGDFEDHAGVRWVEMRKVGAGDWDLFQEGTWSPDAEGRFMSMGAIDQDGNILLAYNVSSTSVFPSIRYTGRLATDPLGVMTLSETELGTGNGVNSSFRYGDYNQMGVDPVDGCTFWFLGMYNPNPAGDTKGVRIGAVKFDACGEAGFVLASDQTAGDLCTAGGSDSFITDIDVLSVGGFEEPVTLAFDPALPSGFTGDFVPNPVVPDSSSTATIIVDTTVVPGPYTLTVQGTATGVDPEMLDLSLTVVDTLPAAPTLLTPPDGAIGVSVQPEFTWSAVDQTEVYALQVATDPGFGDPVIDVVVEGTAFTPSAALATDTTYFWRVQGSNPCGDGAFSAVFSFTTFAGPPVADISPSSFEFALEEGQSDTGVLDIGNVGDVDLEWSITEDEAALRGVARSHDPALDEPLDLGDFQVISPANGGSPVVITVPGGVATHGLVVGFHFIGTASGMGDTGSWASDTCLIVEAPDGTTFGVGGFTGTNPSCNVNDWDFQGSGSAPDGTYESEHDDVFPGVEDQGDWTFTFINDWNNTAAATISWADVTVTLHKAPLPFCDDITEVPWLSVSPVEGVTPPAGSVPVDVTVDATGLTVGTHEAALCVATNDPSAEVVPVPLSLTVTPGGGTPEIDVDPESLSFTVPAGGSDADDLAISNIGEGTLTWNIETAEPLAGVRPAPRLSAREAAARAAKLAGGTGAAVPVGYTRLLPGERPMPQARDARATNFVRGGDIVGDGGFEAGSPNPVWTEASTNFGTPLCDVGGCGVGGGTGPHGGSWWAWFGGINAVETGSVVQDVTIPSAGSAELRFWLEIPVAQNAGFLDVSIDGDVVFGVTEADGPFVGYMEVVVDVSEYADGGTHELRFDSTTQPGAGVTNFFVDDVSITVGAGGGGCDDPTTIPWLSVTPDSGSTDAGETDLASVMVDAGALDAGDYSALLCVNSNDPDEPLIPVPVSLTVTAGGEQLCFVAELDGAQETPPVDTDATGHGDFTYDLATRELTWDISHDLDLADVTMAHIHEAPIGVPGPIVIALDHTVNPIVGSATLTEDQEGDLLSELYYVNIHTMAHSGGEIRGQILPCEPTPGAFTPMALQADTNDGALSDGNGVFEPGETVDVAPSWRNDGDTAQSLTGEASQFTGPAGADYSVEDDAADYGMIDPDATASCGDLDDCYLMALDDPASRPLTHWDATFEELLSDGSTTKIWTLHIGDSFSDVARASIFYSWIETLLHNGVTGGCTETTYCPAAPNTRAQMSVFLLKALEGPGYAPPACTGVFADVPCPSLFANWIEDLAGRGVTAGCGGGNYCPNASVSRDQMAVFLLKTLEGPGYTPPACTGVFGDVPCPSLFANWIEDLVDRGITAGCGGGNYCPGSPVSRDQMAVFLSKTFDLALYGP